MQILKKGRKKNIWLLSLFTKHALLHTKDYIKKILVNSHIYENIHKNNFISGKHVLMVANSGQF
jgi:hypothetical protein